jgi:hypothetical protein
MDSKIIEIIKSKSKKYQKLSDILKYLFVDIAHIDQSKYYILGSYAIRTQREINDLDINLDYNEFFKLKALTDKSIGSIEIYNNQIRWFFDITNEYNKITNSNENDFSIEAFQKIRSDGFPNTNFSLDYLRNNDGLTTDNNGHQFFKLETLLEWKKTMNRPKDKPDIELIQQILESKNKLSRTTKKLNIKKSSRKSRKNTKNINKKTTSIKKSSRKNINKKTTSIKKSSRKNINKKTNSIKKSSRKTN